MKFPLVRRSVFEHWVDHANKLDLRVNELAKLADAEYDRAMDEGKRMVREWVVEANYNLFFAPEGTYRAQVNAALQDAIGQFRPRNWSSIS